MGTHNLAATLIAGRGVVLIGDETAIQPTYAQFRSYIDAGANESSLPTGFTPLGETDPEALPEWSTAGGAPTVKRTWRVEAARETKTPAVHSMIVNPLQFDNATMRLREGIGDETQPGVFVSPAITAPTEAPILIVYLDGSNPVGEYLGRCSIGAADSITHGIEDWSKIPLRCTQLDPTDSKPKHAWIGRWFGTDPTVPVGP